MDEKKRKELSDKVGKKNEQTKRNGDIKRG